MSKQDFEIIYNAAFIKDASTVRVKLQEGLNYRDAQVYCELIKSDPAASKFIYDQCHCVNCGNLMSSLYFSECGSCRFSTGMEKIEYRKL